MEIQVTDIKTSDSFREYTMCIAKLYKDRDDIIPLGNRTTYDNHPVKQLEWPIAGKYADDFDNPSFNGEAIEEYYYTDFEGKLSFEDMRFSMKGPSGNYTLSFS